MKIKEKVVEIMQTQSFQSKQGDTLYSRDLIVETDEKYPKKIALTFKGANCNLLDAVHEGDIIEATFDIESRKVNDRYFTTLTAWKLTIVESPAMAASIPQTPATQAAPVTSKGNVIIPD